MIYNFTQLTDTTVKWSDHSYWARASQNDSLDVDREKEEGDNSIIKKYYHRNANECSVANEIRAVIFPKCYRLCISESHTRLQLMWCRKCCQSEWILAKRNYHLQCIDEIMLLEVCIFIVKQFYFFSSDDDTWHSKQLNAINRIQAAVPHTISIPDKPLLRSAQHFAKMEKSTPGKIFNTNILQCSRLKWSNWAIFSIFAHVDRWAKVAHTFTNMVKART